MFLFVSPAGAPLLRGALGTRASRAYALKRLCITEESSSSSLDWVTRVVQHGCCAENGDGPCDTDDTVDPKEDSVDDQRHVLPVFLRLFNQTQPHQSTSPSSLPSSVQPDTATPINNSF